MADTGRIKDNLGGILRRYSSRSSYFLCGCLSMCCIGAVVLGLVTRSSGGSFLRSFVHGGVAFGAVGGALMLAGHLLRLDGKTRAVREFNWAFPTVRADERKVAIELLATVGGEHQQEARDLHDALSGKSIDWGTVRSPEGQLGRSVDEALGHQGDERRAGGGADAPSPPKTAKPFKPYQPFERAKQRLQEQQRAPERSPYVPFEPDKPESGGGR